MKSIRACHQPALFVFNVLFLNVAQSEIPGMFQITHRQNLAVKTQTGEGLPGPVTRSEGSTLFPALPPFPTIRLW